MISRSIQEDLEIFIHLQIGPSISPEPLPWGHEIFSLHLGRGLPDLNEILIVIPSGLTRKYSFHGN